MTAFLTDLRQTLLGSRDSKQGPLPPMLVTMTLVTGLVDAFSYLVLGHVFVANMTGNVVLLGFALVGAPGLFDPRILHGHGVVRPRWDGGRSHRGPLVHPPGSPAQFGNLGASRFPGDRCGAERAYG